MGVPEWVELSMAGSEMMSQAKELETEDGDAKDQMLPQVSGELWSHHDR